MSIYYAMYTMSSPRSSWNAIRTYFAAPRRRLPASQHVGTLPSSSSPHFCHYLPPPRLLAVIIILIVRSSSSPSCLPRPSQYRRIFLVVLVVLRYPLLCLCILPVSSYSSSMSSSSPPTCTSPRELSSASRAMKGSRSEFSVSN